MSDSWISENEERMDMADKWVSHAEREGIQEEWHDAYDGDEEPHVKNIDVWIQVSVETNMTPKEVKQLLLDKLNKEEWEFE
jgi:hypothetical protein|tara:strand:- start:22 stop:264 length:243 start_codon:yes stop_codon:yes gene_type:complete